jgi:hypothetical protein
MLLQQNCRPGAWVQVAATLLEFAGAPLKMEPKLTHLAKRAEGRKKALAQLTDQNGRMPPVVDSDLNAGQRPQALREVGHRSGPPRHPAQQQARRGGAQRRQGPPPPPPPPQQQPEVQQERPSQEGEQAPVPAPSVKQHQGQGHAVEQPLSSAHQQGQHQQQGDLQGGQQGQHAASASQEQQKRKQHPDEAAPQAAAAKPEQQRGGSRIVWTPSPELSRTKRQKGSSIGKDASGRTSRML